jgi:hypothetical protein
MLDIDKINMNHLTNVGRYGSFLATYPVFRGYYRVLPAHPAQVRQGGAVLAGPAVKETENKAL